MDQAETIKTGSILGEFEIEKEIGKGGMGVVYKAHEPSLNRKVALKILSRMLSNDEEFISRFKKEARIIASLNHPNIVKILTFGRDLGHYYFAMEYIQGKDLHKILKEKIKIPVDEALLITRQVADALSEANQMGVVHRDLKPANIMLDKMNRVRVTDFGVARVEGSTDELTRTGAFLGSPQYASPEQATGMPIDTRSDIYSLGAVLYRMLSGTPPTTGDSPLAVMIKVATDTVTPIDQVNPSVPKPICELIGKMMAKNPDHRFQTSQEVIKAIDECSKLLKQKNAILDEETVVFSGREDTPAAAARSGKIFAASVLCAVVLLFVLVYFHMPPFSQKPAWLDQIFTPSHNQDMKIIDKHSRPDQRFSDKIETKKGLVDKVNSGPPTALVEHAATPKGQEEEKPRLAQPSPTALAKTAATSPPAVPQPEDKTRSSQKKEIIPASIQPGNKVATKTITLPKTPTILLLVTGIESMTPFLYSHLETNMIASGLRVISPIDIPVLRKKMQYGSVPFTWYDIKHILPAKLAQILVMAKIQKAGSTILKYDGYSQEQITAVFSIRTRDMTSGAAVQRSLTGTFRCTALNMDEEIEATLSKTAGNLGPSITKYWQKKLHGTTSPTPAALAGQGISTSKKNANTPTVLLIVTGTEETSLLFRSNLESSLLDNNLYLLSPEEFPILKKKIQVGGLPVNLYDIKQFLPDNSADVIVLANIQKSGTSTLKYGERDQELVTASYSIRTLDLTDGSTVKPSATGVIRYTALNMDDAFKDALAKPLYKLGEAIRKYWAHPKKRKRLQVGGNAKIIAPPVNSYKKNQNYFANY